VPDNSNDAINIGLPLGLSSALSKVMPSGEICGIMIYDITNPNEPYFVKYLYDPDNKDISPEGITFESNSQADVVPDNSNDAINIGLPLGLSSALSKVMPSGTSGESNDDDTTPNPPSENEGSNTDHDVDNGEQPDNGDVLDLR
jgi:hypothetical protein